MNAIIYARFSPRRNADQCESIETQIERCAAYCAANGYTVVAGFEDRELSGSRADNRPGLQAALKAAAEHKAVLVVYSLSRLARNTRDAMEISERLERAGANWASLHEKIDTSTAMGRFVFTVMSALAQLEREQIAERTRDAMRRHQANGRRMSDRTPYGFTRDPQNAALLIEDPDEQRVIQRIVELHREGHRLRQIGRTLEETGDLCRGSVWYHSTIKNILKRVGEMK